MSQEDVEIKVIGRIHTDFSTKFGVPRQSGLVKELKAKIIFEPAFRAAEAVRGLEAYSHIWLLWQFSEAVRDTWSPTVRPPRLGGNVRMGVFATRSPFRPNNIGLSSVKLDSVELLPELGPVLNVSGADMMDGTPIFDIKPYITYADCHPEATGGFTDTAPRTVLRVSAPENILSRMPEDKRQALLGVLANDPRPSYQNDPERIYGFQFAGFEVRFRVSGDALELLSISRDKE